MCFTEQRSPEGAATFKGLQLPQAVLDLEPLMSQTSCGISLTWLSFYGVAVTPDAPTNKHISSVNYSCFLLDCLPTALFVR